MEDKTVFISGGTSGLGLATAQLFLEKGATVIVAARNEDKFTKGFEKYSKKAHFISTDFADMDAVKNLYEKIATDFSHLDIAVNNVGVAILKPMVAYTEAEFDTTINVNLKSLWLGMKMQIPLLQNSRSSRTHIVNISSVNGLGGAEYVSLYAAAKAGVIALTKSAALEQARSNISINAVVPGAFATPMLDSALDLQSGGNSEQKAAIEQQYQQMIPQGRFGDPREIAETIFWLCSGNNRYISGHSLIIDGGMSSRYR